MRKPEFTKEEWCEEGLVTHRVAWDFSVGHVMSWRSNWIGPILHSRLVTGSPYKPRTIHAKA